LNELLGAKEPGEGEAVANVPKTEAEMPERAPEKFQPGVSEAIASGAENLNASQVPLPKPANATNAACERAR
jgi:hypothetical protein